MLRPSFRVVTSVVATLVVFGIVTKYLQQQITPVKANPLANSDEAFLYQAGEQQIDWQPFNDRVFARALHLGLPVLVVAGSGDSGLGRVFDKAVLTWPGVQTLLRREFICTRVDTDVNPRWGSAFLPATRAQRIYLQDVGAYVLSPAGQLMSTSDVYLPSLPNGGADYTSFLSFLSAAGKDAMRRPGGDNPQAEEVAALEGASGPGLPDFASHLQGLIQLDNPNGGFPVHGNQDPLPLAWRFLLFEGRTDAFRASIDPALLSPIVNWLDGGFFRRSDSLDWSFIEFDESAELDAEMMWTLALAGSSLNDPFYRKIAERTFDRLMNDFGDDGWVAAWQEGDEKVENRSARYSFPPRLLRELIPDSAKRDWIQENLQMRVAENPLMVPQLKSKAVLLEPEAFDDAMKILRAGRTEKRKFGSPGTLEVNGLVSARLIACARLWKDSSRLQQATELALRLDSFRASDDVSRTSVAGDRSQGFLPDYLAYADSCLETFLATGRLDRFREGETVLRRAKFLFATKFPGVFHLDSQPVKAPLDSNPPEILDHYRESCSAWLMRLSLAYGTLAGPRGKDLTQAAYAIAGKFSSTANNLGPYVSGYFCSAARLSRAEAAFAVGPKADQLARDLYELVPSRLVAIAGGDVRPDLARRAPGIYIVRDVQVTGPLTVAQAAQEMPFAFPYDGPIPQ